MQHLYIASNREPSSVELAVANQHAQAAALDDLDSFADWLWGECGNQSSNAASWLLRWPHKREQNIAEAKVSDLVHALLDTDDLQDLKALRDQIKLRYLQSRSLA